MERNYNKEKRQFFLLPKHRAELRTQTYIGIKIGYITANKGNQWIQETKELQQC